MKMLGMVPLLLKASITLDSILSMQGYAEFLRISEATPKSTPAMLEALAFCISDLLGRIEVATDTRSRVVGVDAVSIALVRVECRVSRHLIGQGHALPETGEILRKMWQDRSCPFVRWLGRGESSAPHPTSSW